VIAPTEYYEEPQISRW